METSTLEKTSWSILSLLQWSSDYLSGKEFDHPRLTLELLLCEVLNCQRIDLYTNFDKPLAPSELARFKAYLKRRLAHEPLQYILGESHFMGLRFIVDRRVLIPRPETEVLVEQVLRLCKNSTSPQIILDIGTGCGNIAISLAKYLEPVQVDGIDVSLDALEVARLNVREHEVEQQVELMHVDILQPPGDFLGRRYSIIVSNPPYISKSEFKLLEAEVRVFEPDIATTDHSDGLTFFRAIADIGRSVLNLDGWVFVETAYNQSIVVSNIFREAGYQNVESFSDYSGIDRVLKAQWV